MIYRTGVTDEGAELVAELFEQYHQAVFAYLYRLLNDRDWAHDLTQDVFVKLLDHRHKLAEVDNRRAWIYRVASNLAFNALKRRRRFAWLPWQSGDALGLNRPGPADQVGRELAVEEALNALPAGYRAPLLLYSHYDLSVREIAAALQISEGAVKNRLYRGREMFRQAYEKGTES